MTETLVELLLELKSFLTQQIVWEIGIIEGLLLLLPVVILDFQIRYKTVQKKWDQKGDLVFVLNS
ncbi:hypothetical protein [Algoriphagus terrigena]|uniref:hypothetical protein n=1 Tax=Algoriphagus terrigena TaxID=344884 RepID=UPI00047B6978|nr:hypothetical protein [Algoriphagus terrigena]